MVLVPLLVLLASCTAALDDDPGGVAPARAAITMGTADPDDPAVVALVRGSMLVCTGTLIGPDAVLTAAHCGDADDLDTAFFGDVYGEPGTSVRVAHFTPHPEYDRVSLDHDIAVARLTRTVSVPPAALPATSLDALAIGSDVRVVGFGVPSPDRPNMLRRRTGTAHLAAVEPLAFSVDPAPSQPCNGDSGGPSFVLEDGAEVIAGVHSNGEVTCLHGARETRTDVHAEFLADFLRPLDHDDGCAVAPGRSRARSPGAAPAALVLATLVLASRYSGRRCARSRSPSPRSAPA